MATTTTKKRLVTILGVACAALLLGGHASAITVTSDSVFYSATDCASMGCDGATLFLQIQEDAVLDYTWNVTLTIDTTGYSGSKSGMTQAGFGAIHDWISVSLVSDPGGGWIDPVGSVVNSTPCTADDGDHYKICTSGYAAVGGSLTWEMVVTGDADTWLAGDPGEWHIGGQFADQCEPGVRGCNDSGTTPGNLISTQSTPIPEPSAALTFALAVGIASQAVRRSRN